MPYGQARLRNAPHIVEEQVRRSSQRAEKVRTVMAKISKTTEIELNCELGKG